MGPLHAERLATGTAVLLDGRGRVLLTRCHVAGRPLARLVGLLATGRLRPGEGLLLRPCRSVHAVGLRPAIGVALLDAAGGVLLVADPLPRGRTVAAAGAVAVVEAGAGVLGRLAPGERVVLVSRSERAKRRPDGGGSGPPGRLPGAPGSTTRKEPPS